MRCEVQSHSKGSSRDHLGRQGRRFIRIDDKRTEVGTFENDKVVLPREFEDF